MVTAFPTRESERSAEAMLQMILDYWHVDLLSMYGATDAERDEAAP